MPAVRRDGAPTRSHGPSPPTSRTSRSRSVTQAKQGHQVCGRSRRWRRGKRRVAGIRARLRHVRERPAQTRLRVPGALDGGVAPCHGDGRRRRGWARSSWFFSSRPTSRERWSGRCAARRSWPATWPAVNWASVCPRPRWARSACSNRRSTPWPAPWRWATTSSAGSRTNRRRSAAWPPSWPSAVSPHEVFEAVAAELGRILGADFIVVNRFEPDRMETVVGSWKSDRNPQPAPPVGSRWSPGGPEPGVRGGADAAARRA